MSGQHKFQHDHAMKSGGKVLNVGCKEDPAKIYECGEDVINLDIMNHDPHTNINMAKDVPGFVQADFLEWEAVPFSFDTIVIGEVLEHCDEHIIHKFLNKAYMLLKADGKLVITVPHDPRPKSAQYGRQSEYYTHREGISSWHRTLVTKDFLEKSLQRGGFKVDIYERCDWNHHENMYWHMVVCTKDELTGSSEEIKSDHHVEDVVEDVYRVSEEEKCQANQKPSSESGSSESSSDDTPADIPASTTEEPSSQEESQTSTSSTKEDGTPSS